MPSVVYEILELLASLLRLFGMIVFGLGVGWFALEFLRKGQQAWQLQIAIFLGFIGLGIALAYFITPGALGGFALGAGFALLFWGLPKKKKDEDKD
ncbi:MAG: hypothetical protein ABIJ39_09560 [Chloroflexota bacterium]